MRRLRCRRFKWLVQSPAASKVAAWGPEARSLARMTWVCFLSLLVKKAIAECLQQTSHCVGFPDGSVGKESTCNAGIWGSIPGLGTPPGEGKGNPLHYSCLGNPMDRGAWWATVHGVTKSQTWLSERLKDFLRQRWKWSFRYLLLVEQFSDI